MATQAFTNDEEEAESVARVAATSDPFLRHLNLETALRSSNSGTMENRNLRTGSKPDSRSNDSMLRVLKKLTVACPR
jgi:hypothetical protein